MGRGLGLRLIWLLLLLGRHRGGRGCCFFPSFFRVFSSVPFPIFVFSLLWARFELDAFFSEFPVGGGGG